VSIFTKHIFAKLTVGITMLAILSSCVPTVSNVGFSRVLTSSSKITLEVVDIYPKSPQKLKSGEQVLVTLNYKNPTAQQFYVYIVPLDNDTKFTTGASYNSSKVQTSPSGTLEQWFTIRLGISGQVSQIKVFVLAVDSQNKVTESLFEGVLPSVAYTFVP
jgi:hypothetical protein